MAIFEYNPEGVKNWSKNVVDFLSGDGDESFRYCSKKFDEQIEKLVQPKVWTGAAAKKNYDNFMDAHRAMVNFTNVFGEAFEETMNKVNTSVKNLETANLGANTNVGNVFGTLTYDQIANLSESNINVEWVVYDYATITSIGTALKEILAKLEADEANLKNKIGELNSGRGIWEGNVAGAAREVLESTLTSNMAKVKEALNICISNISAAAEAARMADQA